MKRISRLVGQQLKWVQPSTFKVQYELQADNEVAATLRFRSSFGSFATGESADGCWTFKRVGFWQTRATVRACGADDDLAIFKNNTWSDGGTLELSDGRKYLATTSFWQTKLELRDESGGSLIAFITSGVLHLSAAVEIQPGAVRMPELPWMVMFGFYLTVMMQMDSGSVTACLCASASA